MGVATTNVCGAVLEQGGSKGWGSILIKNKMVHNEVFMMVLKDYRGHDVRLTGERMKHIFEHQEMAGMKTALEETLCHPVLVIQSRADESATLNYRYYFGTKVGDKWLCVVVKYAGDDAFVLTAYLTDRPKKGRQLWPKK